MSLVTRCPACATAFKVVRDQLRISDGWVRCGRCSQVFDATLDLQESADDAVPLPPAAPSGGRVAFAHEPRPPGEGDLAESGKRLMAPAHAMPWPAADLLELRPAMPPDPCARTATGPSANAAAVSRASELSAWPAPVGLPMVVADEPWPVHAAAPATVGGRPTSASAVDEAVNAQLQKALRRARIQALRESRARERTAARSHAGPQADARPADAVSTAAPALAPEPKAGQGGAEAAPRVLPDPVLRQASSDEVSEAVSVDAFMAPVAPFVPSFLEAPVNTAPPPAPRRSVLVTATVLAGLLLAGQVLHHERDVLAARHPTLQPALAALCRLSGCELAALRRSDAIRIDGSSFTPEQDGTGYRLLFSLRNSATTPLAMPAIELSLLDGNERAVVRRVFQPGEFGAPAVLAARAEQSATLALVLKMPADGSLPPVVGYSLLAFYP